MIYKFKSKVSGDVIMVGPAGEQTLRLIGKDPSAQGIIEPDQMLGAVQALEQAIAADEAAPPPVDDADAASDDEAPGEAEGVSLRRRVWPLIDMMKRAQAAGVPIVWGV